MSYQVSVDLGATRTTAAVCRSGRAELAPLGPSAISLPTVAFVNADGSVAFGPQAEALAPSDPGRVARGFTRRIGDPTPLRLGGASIPADVLAARFVRHVVDTVAARSGGPAERVALVHPDGWGKHRLTSLRNALVAQGLGATAFLSAAQAAAEAHARRARIASGRLVAVADLGGSAMTATLVRATPDGRFAPVGATEEVEIGGVDLDEVVFEHVRAALGTAWDEADLAGLARLRVRCEQAKEALSADTDVSIPVDLPGIDTSVRLTRAEFEELIGPAAAEFAAALDRVIGDADPAAVLMVGGTARIPLLTQVVSAQLNRPVTVAADPGGEAAIGAALAVGRMDVAAAEPTVVELPPGPTQRTAPPPMPVPERPPVPMTKPPGDKRGARLFGLPRTAAGVAAAVLVAASAGGAILLARYTPPSGAGADTGTSTTVTTVDTVDTTTPTAEASTTTESAETTTQRRKPKRQAPPETTTTEPTTTTTDTTTTTASDDTTTTTPDTSAADPGDQQNADAGAPATP